MVLVELEFEFEPEPELFEAPAAVAVLGVEAAVSAVSSASCADCRLAWACASADVGGVGVDPRQQLVAGHVLAGLDVDVGDLAAGGEVHVGLVGGLEVAAARDRRLDHAARDGDRPLLSAGGRGGPDDDHRADHRRGGQGGERDRGEGRAGAACQLALRLVVPWPCGACPFGGPPRKSTPHFCSAARSFWNCAEPGPFGPP